MTNESSALEAAWNNKILMKACEKKKKDMAKNMKSLPAVSDNKKDANKMADGMKRTKAVAS